MYNWMKSYNYTSLSYTAIQVIYFVLSQLPTTTTPPPHHPTHTQTKNKKTEKQKNHHKSTKNYTTTRTSRKPPNPNPNPFKQPYYNTCVMTALAKTIGQRAHSLDAVTTTDNPTATPDTWENDVDDLERETNEALRKEQEEKAQHEAKERAHREKENNDKEQQVQEAEEGEKEEEAAPQPEKQPAPDSKPAPFDIDEGEEEEEGGYTTQLTPPPLPSLCPAHQHTPPIHIQKIHISHPTSQISTSLTAGKTPIFQPSTEKLPNESPTSSPLFHLREQLSPYETDVAELENKLAIQKLEIATRLQIHIDIDHQQGYLDNPKIPNEHLFGAIRMSEYIPQTRNDDNNFYRNILNEELYTISVQLPTDWCLQYSNTSPRWFQVIHTMHEDHSAVRVTDDLLRAIYDKWFTPSREMAAVQSLGPLTEQQASRLFSYSVFFLTHYEWLISEGRPFDMRYLRPYMTRAIKPEPMIDPFSLRHINEILANRVNPSY